MKNEKLKQELDKKFDSYIFLGKEDDLDEVEFFTKATTPDIMEFFKSAFEKYPELKETVKNHVFLNE